MKNFFKKGITFALAFTLVVTMCFGSIGAAEVHAADTADDRHALSVYDGDKLVKDYTLADLKEIAKNEGDIKYKFSGYNRNPSFYTFGDENAYASVKDVVGPSIAGILKDAGVTYNEDQLISFAAPDGVTESFVASDLFQERYYFPNGRVERKGDGYTGTPVKEENYEGAVSVVPMLDLYRSDEWESVLRFGQVAPNEQNNSAYVKYIADGGKIIIGDVQTAAWEPITNANYNSGVILPETEIIFDVPKSIIGKKVAAYYTTDGTEPGHGDAIYNYNKYGDVQKIVLPVTEGTVTYTFKVIGYGKLDSEITIFTYEVVDVDQPAVPAELTVKPSTDNHSVIVEWTPSADADGYEVLRYYPETDKFEVIMTMSGADSNSLQDGTVPFGVEQRYQVRAFKQLSSGQKVYSSATPEQKVTLPIEDAQPVVPEKPEVEPQAPVVAKATLKSVAKTGYGGIQVKWNKVKGANGYEVLRTDAKGNKFVKTFTNGSTVSWKNTGLKTGRKYTYKVRAYVNFNGKKVYGKYSGIKSATPALNKPVISKLTPGKKAITVKWKKVSGANGYKIYRSTAKNGKYTCVKTIKKGGTLSWKNTKLKKGKRYYYKVKAYRIVDKKYVYSSISSVKYIKSK